MKKSLMIISFAFIFLLSVSVVSAGIAAAQRLNKIECGYPGNPPCDNNAIKIAKSNSCNNPMNRGATCNKILSKTATSSAQIWKVNRVNRIQARSPSMLNCPPNWDAKSARDGGGYCVQKGRSLGDDKLDPTAATCVTTCGEIKCTSYGSHPDGWCCICTGYSQSCVTECTEEPVVVVVEA